MYKGLGPTLASLAPFVAINFAAYDTLKAHFFPGGNVPQGPLYSLGMGATAGIIAQVCICVGVCVRVRVRVGVGVWCIVWVWVLLLVSFHRCVYVVVWVWVWV